MACYESKIGYYVVPIIQESESNLMIDKRDFSSYINEVFPILKELKEEGRSLLHNFDKMDHVKNEHYIQYCNKIENILTYLNLPKQILLIGFDFSAMEIVTGNMIMAKGNKNDYIPIQQRLSNNDFTGYYIENYAVKINNFFNPSIDTVKKAHLSIEQIMQEMNKKEKIKKLFYKKKGGK